MSYGYVKGLHSRFGRHNIKVHPSDSVKEGEILMIDNVFTPYSNGAYLHPADYIWYKHGSDIDKAHNMWQVWFDRNADRMVQEAIDRINAMYREKD